MAASLPKKVAYRDERGGNADPTTALQRAQRMAQQLAQSVDQIKTYISSVVEVAAAALATRVTSLETNTFSMMLLNAVTTTLATAVNTSLTFPVKAGDIWDVEFWGDGSCSTTNGMQYAIGAPGGSTVDGWIDTSSINTAVANWLTIQITAVNTLAGACHAGASNAPRPDRLNARVQCAAAGFITIQFATVTAGFVATIAAKAYLRATRVSGV